MVGLFVVSLKQVQGMPLKYSILSVVKGVNAKQLN